MYRVADSMGYFNRTDEQLLNPHIGFQTFQRFNGDLLHPSPRQDWTEGFPIEYRPYTGSLDNGPHPMTTVAYYRVYWRYFEPGAEGQYNWDLIDRALATAQERRQTLMLRLPPHGSFDWPQEQIADDSDLPPWLRAKLGPKPFFPACEKKDGDYLKYFGIVDVNDPLFVQSYARAIKALAERYDGDPRLDSVDLCICGTWGEESGIELMTEENRTLLFNAYLDNFKNTPLLAQSNQSEIHGARCNVRKDVDNRVSLLRWISAQGKRVGLRGDCLGDMSFRHDPHWHWSHMRSLYPYVFGASVVQDMWKRGPISFEACGVMNTWLSRGFDLDYILEQALLWHTSTFSNKGTAVPEQYRPAVERWLKKLGYRFAIRNCNYPGIASPGDTLELCLWLENCGVAPIYRNYPFILRLKGERQTVDRAASADIRDWLPGDIILNEDWALPANLTPGAYLLQAGIPTPVPGMPTVRFACDAPEDEGFYTIGKITIL